MELDPRTILEHDARLRRLARALMRDAAAADDVVQRAWVVALSERANIASPLAWLRCVVRNLVLERFRGESRQVRRERAAALPDHTPDTAELVERESLRRQVFEAVIALPEPFRRTLVLRYFEDLSPREIAAREGAPIDTIQSRLKRGRELLAERLAPSESNGRREFFRALAPIGAAAPLPSAAWLASTVGISVMSLKLKSAVYVVALALGVVALYQFTTPTPDEEPTSAPSAAAIETPSSVDRAADDPVAGEVAREPVPTAEPLAEPAVGSEAKRGSLAVTVLFDPEGAVAAGIEIDASWEDDPEARRASRRVRTDAGGQFQLEDLPAGYVTFLPLTGGMRYVELAEGEQKEFELRIPAGARLTGIVRDGAGQPFPGASIFLTQQVSAEGAIVAITDRAGRFEIRNVSSLHYLGARADGFVPSPLQLVLGGAGGEHEFEFTLGTRAAALEGNVVALDGSPIAGATVVFDPENHAAGTTGIGQDILDALPQITTSDAAGAFRFGGVPRGSFEVKARARRFSYTTETVEISESGAARVILRLEPAGRLVGTVLDTSGIGLEQVRLSAASYSLLESFSGTTRESGDFVIEDVPLGPREIRVESESHGTKVLPIVVERGADTRLDVLLTRGRAIRGVVVEESGRPLEGVSLIGIPSDRDAMEQITLQAVTSKFGSFELTNVPEGDWNLEFMVPPDYFFPTHIERKVSGDGPVLRVVIPKESIPSAKLRARVVDSDGNPIVGAQYAIVRRGINSGPLLTTGQDGRIEFGPVSPGEYAIMVDVRGFPTIRTDFHPLTSGQTKDVGDILVVAGQRLLVSLRRDSATMSQQAHGVISGLDSPGSSIVEFDGDRGRSDLVVPGRYRLDLTGVGIAAMSIDCVIEAGSDTSLELTTSLGHPREFVVARDPQQGEARVPYRIEDSMGRRVAVGSLWPTQRGDSFRAQLSFAPGRYVAWFERPSRDPVRFEFEVTESGSSELVIDTN